MRVRCAPGDQSRFIFAALSHSLLSLAELAAVADVSRHTLAGWRDEECNATLEGLTRLHLLTGVPLPAFVELIDDAEWRSRLCHA